MTFKIFQIFRTFRLFNAWDAVFYLKKTNTHFFSQLLFVYLTWFLVYNVASIEFMHVFYTAFYVLFFSCIYAYLIFFLLHWYHVWSFQSHSTKSELFFTNFSNVSLNGTVEWRTASQIENIMLLFITLIYFNKLLVVI